MDHDIANPLVAPQAARAAIRFGDRFVMEAEARATPLGLLAVGGLVAAILLAIPPIVRAKRAHRALPRPVDTSKRATLALAEQIMNEDRDILRALPDEGRLS